MRKEIAALMALGALAALQGCASLLSENDKRILLQAPSALSGATNRTQQELYQQEQERRAGRLACDPTWNGGMSCRPANY